MKLAVIGHPDAVWGFSLVGVQGHIVESIASLNKALDTVLADRTIGIVLITADVAGLEPERISALKLRADDGPLVIEIPAPDGPQADQSDLARVIQQSTGVRV